MVRFYKWTPSVIAELYHDSIDYKGLYYWYEDLIDYNKQLESELPKKKK